MANLSIIDIGSNTIHLLIVDISNKNSFRILYEDKEHLRLGSELALSKNISNIKTAETIEIIKKYLSICSSFKTSKIIAVATEALRIAENSDYILGLIKNNTGLPIRLLSPHEEAYLSFLGVKKVYNISKGIIVDSGGASTEFIGVKNNTFVTSSSIPLGAINVNEKITTNSDGKFISCLLTQEYFTDIFSNMNWLRNYSGSTLIGIGGTFKNLRSIYKYLSSITSSNNHFTELSPTDLIFLCRYIKTLSFAERKKLKGLSPKRSDIILGGCEIINSFINYLNFQHVIITESGLRTGILFHYMDTDFNHKTCPDLLSIF